MLSCDLLYKTFRLTSSQEDMKKASRILKDGGLVALPTETVYGLAANGFNKEAIHKIYAVKGRPQNNPLILHTDSVEKCLTLFDLDKLARSRLKKLAKTFWPGPLTIVAKKARNILPEVTANLDAVAVRIPAHPISLAIMKEVDFPLAMPSANISTRPSPTVASHVLKTLDGRIEAVLDGGSCAVGIESTIVNINTKLPQILRLGMILKHEIEECLGEAIDEQIMSHDKPLAPGSMYTHYRPLVEAVYLIDKDKAYDIWFSDSMLLIRNKDFNEIEKIKGPRPLLAISKVLKDDAPNYAQELYQTLYDFETWPNKKLYIVNPPCEIGFRAVLDRLTRAANL
jgi:L-threonylcarbamoyladenylate synthase